ncbi:MAG: elongation factor P [Armatimonadetes bacterium]|nr:elongation factor P [Armatimonadota bacterium]
MAFYIDGEVYQLLEFQHVKPGKGGAFVRTRLKKMKSGNVIEKTFRSGEKFEDAYVEKKRMQFLYRSGSELTLMDLDSYEQVGVEEADFGSGAQYLKEEMEVSSMVVDGETLGYELPNTVELMVSVTDPGVKGDTVSGGATKPAKLETGASIQVPFHINEGDMIKVDTRTNAYIERVSKK